MAYENRKSDKYKELSSLIHKSVEKVGGLLTNQNEEMS